ncbi:TPA: NAD(P)-dependent glycerol-3-phosphate dehydrogenase [Candidatus Woesearchaeota archaeon]|nr:MAG: hypothetical protein A3A72_00205 [Deltaproteobacteria bacterium RIFCSPLOWO2_01_FULL_38_9]HIH11090.1 NAD(P)-dependent glycerol-3-phosphate dehydrogenase [Candidatus Woesearchaeota archaeon]
MTERIAILGGGSWGTALAVRLASNGHPVKVWEFFEKQATEMQQLRRCPLLPDVELSSLITVSHQLQEVLPQSTLILVVVPSDKVESTLHTAASLIQNQNIIICSKGFAPGPQLLSDIAQKYTSGSVYCLYGPTHAEEVGLGMLSGIVLAGTGEKRHLCSLFQHPQFKVEMSNDIIGVQVSAALKNILAIFIGICDGLGLGDNAKAYIMTKGLQEITTIGRAWGADQETFYGLAGMGDVIVTCMSKHSRNRHVGEHLGRGQTLDQILAEMKMVAEGVTTAKLIPQLEAKFNVHVPLLRGLHDILFAGKKPQEVLEKL